ncbi:ABC transporter ATP-binding protein [Paenibacillus alginolyticus]|uniref:Quaternary amine transport ATP-binding protein n=1 Tax=Paenibacillus alginolyticus TaxID=59839 RepID=A0ABT4GDB0_9BACL|nr:betaine/proline/choline family ABC transporter ATP-binding protein [Paenibacillus alginolyticus]MCY9694181.1 betaine/proline/choline family ABC transporter ATP-binding protein [Paenibacillus alginolyticus]MEC0142731.1 betaine/proline/choline family ABC transporter ATP-binding protein [Paenibacillus alginolyticus]
MIQMSGVHKVYDDGFKALTNVNLLAKKGEITVLIGPSGCGKSTTMKLINRLIEPTDGSIQIEGKSIRELNPVDLRRKIGYVIQNIGLFPHMTIAKNVAVVPTLLKWEKPRIEARVDELLSLVNMSPDVFRDRYPSELSGGQQQRIGVIRAMAADPDIILMDEPFSALDPISREQLQDELIRLQQEVKKTIIFVTHDMDEAIRIADTIVLMKEGQVVQQGKPEQILRHPADDFVKSFIGQKRLRQNVPPEDLARVDDVMVVSPAMALPTRGLAQAIQMMGKRKVDSLFVVDTEDILKGVVSIYQVLDQYGGEEKTVADVMKPVEHSIPMGTPLILALQLINKHQLSNIPVVGVGGRFVGLITRGTVVRYMADLYMSNSTDAGGIGDVG